MLIEEQQLHFKQTYTFPFKEKIKNQPNNTFVDCFRLIVGLIKIFADLWNIQLMTKHSPDTMKLIPFLHTLDIKIDI